MFYQIGLVPQKEHKILVSPRKRVLSYFLLVSPILVSPKKQVLSYFALFVERALSVRALSFPLRTLSFHRMPHLDRSFSAKETYNYWLFCGKSLSDRALSFSLHTSSFQRPIGCHILIGHFPQKSRIISGSFAERDLQLRHPMHLRHTVSSYGCFLALSTKRDT